MASYQLSTSTPYQGGPIVDLGGVAVTQGGVVAVLQAPRASLRCHQWVQPVADHPALTLLGVSELGSGARSSVLATADQDVAIAYQGVGANAGSLMGWLGINTTFVPAATTAPPGSRPSMSGFASTVDAPPGRGGGSRGDGTDVTIRAVGKRVVTALNQASNLAGRRDRDAGGALSSHVRGRDRGGHPRQAAEIDRVEGRERWAAGAVVRADGGDGGACPDGSRPNRDFAIGTIDSAGTASVRYWRLPEVSAAAPVLGSAGRLW